MQKQAFEIMKPYLAILFIVLLVVVIVTDISTFFRGEATYFQSALSIMTSAVGAIAALGMLSGKPWGRKLLIVWIIVFLGFLVYTAVVLHWTITEIGLLLFFIGLLLAVGEMGLIK